MRPDQSEETQWMNLAACRGMNSGIFYPEVGTTGVAEARAVCQACPVRQECLDYADKYHEVFGVWGGLPTKERRERRAAIRHAERQQTAVAG